MSAQWNPLDHLDEMRELASLGLTEKQIATRLNIHQDVLRYYRNSNAKVDQAIQEGLNNTIYEATRQLGRLINGGDFKAIKFFLEKKGGWSDNIQLEISKPTNKSFVLKQVEAPEPSPTEETPNE